MNFYLSLDTISSYKRYGPTMSVYLFPPTLGADFWTFLTACFWDFCAFLSPAGAFLEAVCFLASLAALTACSLLAMMSWRVAPTTALWNFWVLLFLFLETSSSAPFLCFLLYSTVQEVLRGFLFKM